MIREASNWVKFCVNNIPKKQKNFLAIDLACGFGRNSIFLSNKGFRVIAADLNLESLKTFTGKNIVRVNSDLEKVQAWPFSEKVFDLVVVTYFLKREIFTNIQKSIKRNGFLIYETFGIGQENYGKPKNKNFLLKKNELLALTNNLKLIYYEEIKVISGETKFIKHRIFCKNVR